VPKPRGEREEVLVISLGNKILDPPVMMFVSFHRCGPGICDLCCHSLDWDGFHVAQPIDQDLLGTRYDGPDNRWNYCLFCAIMAGEHELLGKRPMAV